MVRLTSRPAAPLRGAFRPPGDKSITHRAYAIGLLRSGALALTHANPGEDCGATRRAALALGARDAGGVFHGVGPELREPDDVIDCGNSGTTLRLLAGILAGQPFASVLTGDASLRRRPVDRIVEPLRRMGARAFARAGGKLPPLALEGGALRAIAHVAPVASAQVLSCVLLAGLFAEGTTSVELPGAARDHTERMLRAFGVAVDERPAPNGGRVVAVRGPQRLPGGDAAMRVPGDLSAAAFFLAGAAATPGASVTARDVGLNPGRTGILDLLERMGARVTRANVREVHGEPAGDVTVEGPDALRAIDVSPAELPAAIDEIPAWAVAAACARGTSRISGAGELRVKESDRIVALARNLAAVGIGVRETHDGLEIEGGAPRGGDVAACADHRIAMAFAVLGARAAGPVVVDDAASIATSFPDFLATFTALGGDAAAAPTEHRA